MRALVLWEPWATLMAFGLKKVETRSWSTNYRGEIAICAAKRAPDIEWLKLAEEKGMPVGPMLLTHFWFHPGCVLCVVTLRTCFCTGQSELLLEDRLKEGGVGECERYFGNYGFGRYGWVTENCRRLATPVPVTGRQGLFTLPEDVESKVMAQL